VVEALGLKLGEWLTSDILKNGQSRWTKLQLTNSIIPIFLNSFLLTQPN